MKNVVFILQKKLNGLFSQPIYSIPFEGINTCSSVYKVTSIWRCVCLHIGMRVTNHTDIKRFTIKNYESHISLNFHHILDVCRFWKISHYIVLGWRKEQIKVLAKPLAFWVTVLKGFELLPNTSHSTDYSQALTVFQVLHWKGGRTTHAPVVLKIDVSWDCGRHLILYEDNKKAKQ